MVMTFNQVKQSKKLISCFIDQGEMYMKKHSHSLFITCGLVVECVMSLGQLISYIFFNIIICLLYVV
jgi:hypothetical protein